MEFIHPNKDLAQEILKAAQPHIEKGTMLSLKVEDIMTQFDDWFVHLGPDQKLAGFFCFRRPHPDFAEIGSVLSLTKNGPQLVKKFESVRLAEGQTNGCAITKKSPEFFVTQTQGQVLEVFPPWYQKTTDDKHFVCWS